MTMKRDTEMLLRRLQHDAEFCLALSSAAYDLFMMVNNPYWKRTYWNLSYTADTLFMLHNRGMVTHEQLNETVQKIVEEIEVDEEQSDD